MIEEDMMKLRARDLRRLRVLHQVLEKRLTQVEAAALLGLTDRHVRRLVQRVRREGDRAVVHRRRGQPSNRRVAAGLKAKVLRLYARHYGDFGPTLAAEKLAERHGIRVSKETLRGWLREQGVDHFGRRPRPHRLWRARKAHVGELVQLDGSHHAWLEGRGPRCVLMGYIDDASSRVWARFYSHEGTWPALDSLFRYVQGYGVPLALYADRHTTYKSPAEPSVADQLEGRLPQSQFERCVADLGSHVIHAQSPQAKGRIERLFGTFQDRLIKEMRLAGIRTLEAANEFLEGYLPHYNARFAVQPAQPGDLHQPMDSEERLHRLLCLKTTRVLRRDWTVAHEGQLYQVHDQVRATQVVVEDRMDGTIRITHQGRALQFQAITARPVKAAPTSPRVYIRRKPVKPLPDHPWQKRFLPERRKAATTMMR
jgi:transposase